MSILRTLLQPRTLLLLFCAVGAASVLVVLFAASRPVSQPWREVPAPLLVGAVARFEPTQFPRGAPEELIETGEGGTDYLPGMVGGGRVTLVNLWASWCAPCLEELPSLVALGERTGARILPVAQERRSAAQSRALERAGVAGALPILTDPDLSLSRRYAGENGQLPLTVIYDGRGREVGRLAGAADWASPEAARLIAAIGEGAADF